MGWVESFEVWCLVAHLISLQHWDHWDCVSQPGLLETGVKRSSGGVKRDPAEEFPMTFDSVGREKRVGVNEEMSFWSVWAWQCRDIVTCQGLEEGQRKSTGPGCILLLNLGWILQPEHSLVFSSSCSCSALHILMCSFWVPRFKKDKGLLGSGQRRYAERV